MIMFAAPWVCRRCLRSGPRLAVRQWLRKASTASTDGPVHLNPVLLIRARKLAAEHGVLAAALETGFDTKTAKRAGELAAVASALKDWERTQGSIAELNALAQSNDREMSELARDELKTTALDLEVLARKLSTALTPKDPYADMPCIIEFRPGPGGIEGRFFTDTLFRMYKAYCTHKGLRHRVVSYVVSDTAGGRSGEDGESPLQEAIIEVQDTGAYDIFRGEAGMHRVQRVPVTEANGRTHTSAVAIWVLPSFPENDSELPGAAGFDDPNSDFYINPAEVRAETMRARGAGGQHVNKTESAIRLTHVPTGTVVSMQDARSQHRNREEAWKILRSRVAQQRREQREEEAQRLKSSVLSSDRITRGDKIRTYNFNQGRCTDHRSGLDVHNLSGVIEGGELLDKVMESVREWLVAKDVRALIAEEEAAAAAEKKENDGASGKGKK